MATVYYFCSKYGKDLSDISHFIESEKKCSACGYIVYPSINPAIMVIINKDDEICLCTLDML
ncbi:hypothetical protein GUI12_01800 [Anaplasmataceae bacterium AB001_6]|nr:hypothetical protein GUI12_01800 [Anaplasmataceae bacterium AB001_6]